MKNRTDEQRPVKISELVSRGWTFVTSPICPCCWRVSTVAVPKAGYQAWLDGPVTMLIQDAMPELSEDDRELLKTGTHPDCWDDMFPDDEDDDDY